MKNRLKKIWNKVKEKGFIVKLSIIPFLCGLMYAIAGSQNTPKQIRRFGIPILLTLYTLLVLKNFWVLLILSQIGVYSIGHGITDDDWPEDPLSDQGSSLGSFFVMLFREWFDREKSHKFADYCVRGIKALLICISTLIIAVIRQNWLVYGVGSTILVIAIASIAWRGLGNKTVKIGNKIYSILYVDIVVGSLIGLYHVLILTF